MYILLNLPIAKAYKLSLSLALFLPPPPPVNPDKTNYLYKLSFSLIILSLAKGLPCLIMPLKRNII